MKKILFLVLLVSIFMLFSCADGKSQHEQNDALHYNTVNITIDRELKYTAKYENNAQTTALDLLEKICNEFSIDFSHLDGYINSVDGYNNTAQKGWMYFFNGEMPDVGASDYIITKGYDNTVDFKYMNYSEAFPETNE